MVFLCVVVIVVVMPDEYYYRDTSRNDYKERWLLKWSRKYVIDGSNFYQNTAYVK